MVFAKLAHLLGLGPSPQPKLPPSPRPPSKRLPERLAHPGTVTFVDEEEGTSHTESADALPEDIAYVEVGDTLVPVTRAVKRRSGDYIFILQYGADGQCLKSRYLIRTPPTEPPPAKTPD